MNTLVPLVQALRKSEKGATAVEYGIMVAGIAAVIVATVMLLGPQIRTMFTTVLTAIGGTAPAA